MKDNKYRILLMYIFIVVRATNLPKFASISQIFLKVHQILVFSSFFLPKMARLSCYVVFFKELESIAIISVKVTLGWISGLNQTKTDQKIVKKYIYFQ